jgi:ABC-2 type transport system permease protein
MSARVTLATAGRVLLQLKHDPRTIALMLIVPSFLLLMLRFIFDAQPQIFDRVGLILLGVFPFTSMFLVTSVAMLRERTSGTLERLLTTPLNKLDLLAGYGIAFALLAALQSVVAALLAYVLLGLDTAGSPMVVGVIAVLNAVLGMAIGLFTSAFATSEFQAVQFMPLVVMPQALLCGLIAPREQMVGWLQAASDVMPLTYAVDALSTVGASSDVSSSVMVDGGVVVVAIIVALFLAAITLQRRTA